MFKWPQGRIIRTICLVLCLVIAVDLGYRAFEAWSVWSRESHSWRPLVQVIVLGLCSLAVIGGGLVAVGFHPRAVDFLIEVEQEMARVSWPPLNTLVRSTIFIAVMIVALGAGVFAVDWININVLQLLIRDHG